MPTSAAASPSQSASRRITSSSARSVRRSRGEGMAGQCRKVTSAPLSAAMRRAISFVWKRPSGSSNAAIAGTRWTPCSGGRCWDCAISAIVLPHETASPSPGASSSLAISARAGATMPCSPLREDAGTTTARLRSSADRSGSDRLSGDDGRRISMWTIPSSRASCSIRDTVERDTPSRCATSCCESWSR